MSPFIIYNSDMLFIRSLLSLLIVGGVLIGVGRSQEARLLDRVGMWLIVLPRGATAPREQSSVYEDVFGG